MTSLIHWQGIIIIIIIIIYYYSSILFCFFSPFVSLLSGNSINLICWIQMYIQEPYYI